MEHTNSGWLCCKNISFWPTEKSFQLSLLIASSCFGLWLEHEHNLGKNMSFQLYMHVIVAQYVQVHSNATNAFYSNLDNHKIQISLLGTNLGNTLEVTKLSNSLTHNLFLAFNFSWIYIKCIIKTSQKLCFLYQSINLKFMRYKVKILSCCIKGTIVGSYLKLNYTN